MAIAISLFDGRSEDNDSNKKKRFKIDKVGKIFQVGEYLNFKTFTIVPVFGDIAISLGNVLDKAPQWNHNKFDLNLKEPEIIEEMRKSYLLITQIENDSIRFQSIMRSLKTTELRLSSLQSESITTENSSICYSSVHKAISFLSGMNNKVLEQAAWKYLHPNQKKNPTIDDNNQEAQHLTAAYEQVVLFLH